MVRALGIVVVSVFVLSSNVSAAGWAEVADSTFGGYSYYCVDFSSSFGVITGNGSRVMTSTDSGVTWAANTVGFGTYMGCEVLSSTIV